MGILGRWSIEICAIDSLADASETEAIAVLLQGHKNGGRVWWLTGAETLHPRFDAGRK